jgi:hypothetical protein
MTKKKKKQVRTARVSKKFSTRALLSLMKLFMSCMYGSLFPKSSPFAKFCRDFEIKISARRRFWSTLESKGGEVESGERIAGQKNRRKMNPPTVVYLAYIE